MLIEVTYPDTRQHHSELVIVGQQTDPDSGAITYILYDGPEGLTIALVYECFWIFNTPLDLPYMFLGDKKL